jgi:hypothetical protein
MCSSESVLLARSAATWAARIASSEPSVARRILVGKMLNYPPLILSSHKRLYLQGTTFIAQKEPSVWNPTRWLNGLEDVFLEAGIRIEEKQRKDPIKSDPHMIETGSEQADIGAFLIAHEGRPQDAGVQRGEWAIYCRCARGEDIHTY